MHVIHGANGQHTPSKPWADGACPNGSIADGGREDVEDGSANSSEEGAELDLRHARAANRRPRGRARTSGTAPTGTVDRGVPVEVTDEEAGGLVGYGDGVWAYADGLADTPTVDVPPADVPPADVPPTDPTVDPTSN